MKQLFLLLVSITIVLPSNSQKYLQQGNTIYEKILESDNQLTAPLTDAQIDTLKTAGYLELHDTVLLSRPFPEGIWSTREMDQVTVLVKNGTSIEVEQSKLPPAFLRFKTIPAFFVLLGMNFCFVFGWVLLRRRDLKNGVFDPFLSAFFSAGLLIAFPFVFGAMSRGINNRLITPTSITSFSIGVICIFYTECILRMKIRRMQKQKTLR